MNLIMKCIMSEYIFRDGSSPTCKYILIKSPFTNRWHIFFTSIKSIAVLSHLGAHMFLTLKHCLVLFSSIFKNGEILWILILKNSCFSKIFVFLSFKKSSGTVYPPFYGFAVQFVMFWWIGIVSLIPNNWDQIIKYDPLWHILRFFSTGKWRFYWWMFTTCNNILR